LTARTTATVVCELLRITWRSVSAVVDRVIGDRAGNTDMLAGLKRIGIDEIAHRRGHRYLTCVVDHDSGRLVWAAPGRNSETLDTFFEALGTERCSQLTHVTADGAEWIHTVVTKRAPKAALCLDPFHIVAWATKALDEVRRQTWNQLRAGGGQQAAKTFKGSRWALMKNPEDLTGRQRTTLAGIAKTNARLYRAYLLKEQLRMVFAVKGQPGRVLLAGWIVWARRCQIPEFVKLAATITVPAVDHQHVGLRNVERTLGGDEHASTNPDHRAYGFHTPEALICMAMLTRGGLCPPLPGRSHP
jgi:transposase